MGRGLKQWPFGLGPERWIWALNLSSLKYIVSELSSIQSEFRVRRNLRPWEYRFDDLQFSSLSWRQIKYLGSGQVALVRGVNPSPRSREPLGIAKIK